jgi:hypothetical protein
MRATERRATRPNGRVRVGRTPAHAKAFPVENLVVAAPKRRPRESGLETRDSERIRDSGSATGQEQSTPARKSAAQEAGERLAARNGAIQALIGRVERVRYGRMIVRIHHLLRQRIPRGGIVAVISRGDERLVTVPGRRAWHFPQADTGVYAGHHPADSAAAIAHLDRLRARGARYLLIPRTAFWWLDHYREFAEHLDRCSTHLVRDDRTCALFTLVPRRKTK